MHTLLSRIVDRSYCLGCGLCASLAGSETMEMVESVDGFQVPRLKQADANLSFLGQICPGIRVHREHSSDEDQSLYGPFRSLHAAHATAEDIRWRGSSGGVLTALLVHLLETGQVDGVLQAGPNEQDPLRSRAFLNATREEIIRCAGSRYAPVSLLENWDELMRSSRRIAVAGKPCDIAAIRNALRLHPEWAGRVPFLFSFLCMGQPSQRGTQRLVETLGVGSGDVREFWYRGRGWPGQATAIDQDGRAHTCSYGESWGHVLSPAVHFRCKLCPDGFGGLADISCGDAWHLENGKPAFEEGPGRSLVFVRTEAGTALFHEAAAAGRVQAEPFSVAQVAAIQPSQIQRRIYIGARLAALKLLGDRLLDFSGFRMVHHLRRSRLRLAAWNFWGMVQRRLKWKGVARV